MGKIPIPYIMCICRVVWGTCGKYVGGKEKGVEGGYYGAPLSVSLKAIASHGGHYVTITLFSIHNSSFCMEPETKYGLMLLPFYLHLCNFPRYHLHIDSDDRHDKTFLWNVLPGWEMYNSKLGICYLGIISTHNYIQADLDTLLLWNFYNGTEKISIVIFLLYFGKHSKFLVSEIFSLVLHSWILIQSC